MPSFVVNRRDWLELPEGLALRAGLWAAALVLFLSASGALDTDAVNWPQRVSYWLLAVGVGLLASLLLLYLSGPWWSPLAWWKGLAARVLLLLLPVTAAALGLCIAMFGGEWSVSRLAALLPTIAALLLILQIPLLVRHQGQSEVPPAPSLRPPGDLRCKLPIRLRTARLLAIEAQDHYVNVHTDAGSYLLRIRLADAVAAAAPAQGLVVHRSWWVASDAVAEVRRGGGRQDLILTNGLSVPISRARFKEVVNRLRGRT